MGTTNCEIKVPFKITIAACRVNAGLTQEELAKLLGVSKNTYNSWENYNSEISVTALRRISDISGVPMDYIFLPAT